MMKYIFSNTVPTGKTPLGRPRYKWEENITMDLKEIGVNMRNWVDSAQHRDYWRPCECGIEPPGSISGVVLQSDPKGNGEK